MQGTVLKFDKQTSIGLISASDGNRYEFKGENIQSNFDALKTGSSVDFQIDDNNAVQIYLLNASKGNDEKSKIVAGLLAIFLGGLGIHKFYLGYTKTGIIFLLILITYIVWTLIKSIKTKQKTPVNKRSFKMLCKKVYCFCWVDFQR